MKFYPLINTFLYPPLYPFTFYFIKRKRGYPLNLRRRFFFFPEKKYKYMLHFASFGEAKTLRPLLELWQENLEQVLFECVTPTGFEELKNSFPDIEIKLFPYDYYPVVKRVLKRSGINILLLFETELWPGLLSAALEENIQVEVINAKLSEKTMEMLQRFSFFWRKFVLSVSRWFVVSESIRDFLVSYGVKSEFVNVVPDIKYLSSFGEVKEDFPEKKFLERWKNGKKLIVMGSMHRGEEDILKHLIGTDARIIYAPRHLNLVEKLVENLSIMGFKVCLSSEIPFHSDCEIIILDKMGILSKVYSVGDLAVIGGSFIPHGGHNPLEPLNFSVPVVYGPHMENFSQIKEDIEKVGAGKEILPEDLDGFIRDIKKFFPDSKVGKGVELLKGKKKEVLEAYRRYIQR